MSRRSSDPARRARGLATYHAVYGENAPLPIGGTAEFFELLILDQQFAEVWSRSALPIPMRRLLTMGVLAATSRFETLQFQFQRVLTTGEMTPTQVREAVIHLITYVGTPASGDLHRAAENALEAHRTGRDPALSIPTAARPAAKKGRAAAASSAQPKGASRRRSAPAKRPARAKRGNR